MSNPITVSPQLDIPLLKQLKSYVKQLQAAQPTDGLGRPTVLVSPDVLAAVGLKHELAVVLKTPPADALMPVSYMEGLPTVYGVPIWEKLEGEPLRHYELFKLYRMLQEQTGSRSIFKLSQQVTESPTELELIRQSYHWSLRASSYDSFYAMERQQILAFERDKMLTEHRLTADKLFKKCTDYVLDNTDMLTPKTALEWAKLAVDLGRLSVGLEPGKAASPADERTVIQTNISIDNGAAGNSSSKGLEESQEQVASLINIMNSVGMFDKPPEEIVVEEEDVNESAS